MNLLPVKKFSGISMKCSKFRCLFWIHFSWKALSKCSGFRSFFDVQARASSKLPKSFSVSNSLSEIFLFWCTFGVEIIYLVSFTETLVVQKSAEKFLISNCFIFKLVLFEHYLLDLFHQSLSYEVFTFEKCYIEKFMVLKFSFEMC